MRSILTQIIVLIMVTTTLQGAGLPEIIKLDSGPISGIAADSDGVRTWLGIPFAAPPTGELRWRPPQVVQPWEKVRVCDAFGPVCPQPKMGIIPVNGPQSEDCLSLNVWSAATDAKEKRPVMVWIHGGGNTIGGASQRFYNGSQFADNGVVLVSIQYRLGIFGYLAHEALSAESSDGLSGNYGILDIIAALQWVQRNIALFGGDPDNVTIFGESAGAFNCGILLVCPKAKGLFQRVIQQSGVPIGVSSSLQQACSEGQMIFDRLGVQTLDQARNCTQEQLLRAIETKVGILQKGHKFGPVVDGKIVPEIPMKLMKEGRFNHVPIIAGTNADEATLFTSAIPVPGPLAYRMIVRSVFNNFADSVLGVFPPEYAGTPKQTFNKVTTLATFTSPTRSWLRAAANLESDVYLYHFTRVPELSGKPDLGATHGIEIPYVFAYTGMIKPTATDRKLSDQIQQYWINFARNGNPNGTGLPQWPNYNQASDSHLEFGDTIQAGSHLYQKECDLFDLIMTEKFKQDGSGQAGRY